MDPNPDPGEASSGFGSATTLLYRKDEKKGVLSPEDLTGDHVENAAGRADDNVLADVQLAHVLAHARAPDTGVALRPHVVAQRHHHFLDLLRQLTGRGQDQRLHK
jgi:hypothetical protein